MTRIIAVANQKGGVGKTTTAVNLSATLAVAERKTLLIDIDPQGNATSGLGGDNGERVRSVYHVLLGEEKLEDVILPTAIPSLFIAPSNIDLIGAEIEMLEFERREVRLRESIAALEEGFDYIIIDCPPSLSLLTVNALTAAESVVVPLQCEYFALEGLTRLMKTISLIQANFNPGLDLEGILLTMFTARTNLARQVVDEVREHFPDKVFDTIIPRNVRLSEAPSFGKPVLLYDIRSKGSEAYFSFAKEVIAHEQKGTGEGSESPHPGH